jgi:threonyl-tRNA synthetase
LPNGARYIDSKEAAFFTVWTRVRGFTQDDAHLFCRPDQMPAEIDRVLDFSVNILRAFGFDSFEVYLSTRPPKRVGREEDWDTAEAALEDTLKRSGIKYQINEGDGAFYGPKIDLLVKDAIGRPWQLSTIQFDFNLPERFDLSFIGEDGAQHRPFMVHRALLGSMERFFGVLLEHHSGALPVWLCPVQAVLIPIADRHVEYCKQVAERLKKAGLRVQIDAGTERMQAKIRNAQLQKIPYMLVAGDREQENGAVSVRLRSGEDLKSKSVDEFLSLAQTAIDSRKINRRDAEFSASLRRSHAVRCRILSNFAREELANSLRRAEPVCNESTIRCNGSVIRPL